MQEQLLFIKEKDNLLIIFFVMRVGRRAYLQHILPRFFY